MPVMERAGRAYVSASALERHAGIAIKSLPGQEGVVACARERCAPVRDSLREGGDTLVSADALANALGAEAKFDSTRKTVGFEFKALSNAAMDGIARVGQLAPNFRLTRLDGTPVALTDFRGKRVLINSWASW